MPVGGVYHSYERRYKLDFLNRELKRVIAVDGTEYSYASGPMASHL